MQQVGADDDGLLGTISRHSLTRHKRAFLFWSPDDRHAARHKTYGMKLIFIPAHAVPCRRPERQNWFAAQDMEEYGKAVESRFCFQIQ